MLLVGVNDFLLPRTNNYLDNNRVLIDEVIQDIWKLETEKQEREIHIFIEKNNKSINYTKTIKLKLDSMEIILSANCFKR